MSTDRFLVYMPYDGARPRCVLADNIDYLLTRGSGDNMTCEFITDCCKIDMGRVMMLHITEDCHVIMVSTNSSIAAKKETVISVKLRDDRIIMRRTCEPGIVTAQLVSCREARDLFEKIKEAHAGETNHDGTYMLHQNAPGS